MRRYFVTALATVSLASAAAALPSFNKDFQSTYGFTKTSAIGKANCAACHIGKTAKLNLYGASLKDAMKREGTKKLTGSVLKKVEGLDSDRDGIKNIDEIEADMLPGDPTSR